MAGVRAFSQLFGIQRFLIEPRADNQRMNGLMRKLGFKYLKDYTLAAGPVTQEMVVSQYEIVAEERPVTVRPKVIVEDYNPKWVDQFNQLKAKIWPAVSDLANSIEHVGSTSVVGMAAKPVIDIDIVIETPAVLPKVIDRLRGIGYEHRGNLGIEGREALSTKDHSIKHNLYVCLSEGVAFKNHILLRDRLRRDGSARARYSRLKKDLANQFPDSTFDYVEGKTALILEILGQEGVGSSDLGSIQQANKVKR